MHATLLTTCTVLLASFGPAQNRLAVPALFSDHMVIQSGARVPVWGWAAPGQKVTVRIADQSKQATTKPDGTWRLDLDALQAGGPHELVVTADRALTVRDVLVGEVWLGSGQSNMAWLVRRSRDFPEEKAKADLPRIRMFTVKKRSVRAPADRVEGEWKICSPETVGGFSATAFFFGRSLHESLHAPIGLINSSWGGTAIEAWTSRDAQTGIETLASVFAPWEKKKQQWDPERASAQYEQRLERWKKNAAKASAEGKKKPRRPGRPSDPALNQNHPANLYNGMIAPLLPYAIRGAIWYQGERNARNVATATLYREQLPLLIADWRKRWGQGDFPFLWVQLPNFKKRSDDPGAASAWATMRESMLRSLAVPHTGMAITIDVGEEKDIHPKNKQDVGKRLAHWALAKVYGKEIPASGPLAKDWKIADGRVVVSFHHAAGGLTTRDGGGVKGFAIAGADRKWRWAEAKVDGARVVVWHPEIAKPAAVRYGWADNPDCNLVGSAGLPASPFRTDDWEQ